MSKSSSDSSSCPSQQSPDASRGRSSSSCRAGNSKEELEGTAELPQGDVEDDVHVDVDVDVVGIAKLPKDNSLLARFCHLPLIDSNAANDAIHIMSVMTILLMTMLTKFLPKSFKPFKPSILSQEVSVALNRGEELKKLKERLSAAKLIMEKDPSAKPWMLSRF